MMTEFESLGSPFFIKGRGWVYGVKNPGGFPEPNVLTGQDVLIDGQQHHVVGVESFAIGRPYPATLDFGLLVS